MTDKQQPAPERIWIDAQDPTFWNDEDGPSGMVEYVRADLHPCPSVPDEKRLAAIERWMDRHTMPNSNAYADLSRAFSEIRYLLSLLQQPPAASERKHDSDCPAAFSEAPDACTCVFSATGATTEHEGVTP